MTRLYGPCYHQQMFRRALTILRERFHPLHRLRRVRWAARVLAALDRPVARRLTGLEWPIWLRAVRHFSLMIDPGLVEPGIRALFIALARSRAPVVFWDVGANIGVYSLLVLSEDKSARAVLFEPDPENCVLIRRTLARGRIERAILCEVAASDTDGKAAFFADHVSGATGSLESAGQSFVRRNYGIEPSQIAVRTVRLDSLCDGPDAVPTPTLIKIDVEGSEERVVAGARKTITKSRPFIVFESFAPRGGAVARQLESAGYMVISAEGPDAALSEGTNFLAVPPAEQELFEPIRALWRAALRPSNDGRLRPDRGRRGGHDQRVG